MTGRVSRRILLLIYIKEDVMSLIPRDSLFDLDNLFNHFWSPAVSKEMTADFFSPRVDIKEKKGKYEITADLPGVDKDHMSITLENGVLTIEASTEEEKTEKEDGKVIRKERRSGKFMRSFNLGPGVKESDIDAKFKNGVLKLVVPKAKAQVVEPKRIDVK
jgi:HSP20 family protein